VLSAEPTELRKPIIPSVEMGGNSARKLTPDSFIKNQSVAALSQQSIYSEITAVVCEVCSQCGLEFVAVQTRSVPGAVVKQLSDICSG
jgi:hypothetical protein